MRAKSIGWICMTIMVIAMATCSVLPREHPSIACIRAGGEWRWFSCSRIAP